MISYFIDVKRAKGVFLIRWYFAHLTDLMALWNCRERKTLGFIFIYYIVFLVKISLLLTSGKFVSVYA